MIRFIYFSIFFLSTLFTHTGFAQTVAVIKQGGKVVKAISLADFNRRYEDVRKETFNPPTKSQFLEDLVRFEMGVYEAEKRKLADDPVVQDLIRQQLYKSLLEKELGAKVDAIEPTEDEMKAWYKRNPEIRFSHILIEYLPGATAQQINAAKKRATEVYAEVKKSKRPFEELAKLYSDDPQSKLSGGDVGWQSRLTLFPNYYDSIEKIKVGDIKGLIGSPYGFHIVKMTGRRTYENSNKRAVKMGVLEEKKVALFNQYFAFLKKSYAVETNSKLIK